MTNEFEVTNDEDAGRYETEVEGYTAELTYRLTGDRMVITHTGVPPAIEGRGIGSDLSGRRWRMPSPET